LTQGFFFLGCRPPAFGFREAQRARQAEILSQRKKEKIGGVMSRDHRDKKGSVGVELKYCEHCGALWVRECGSGMVYCDNCRPKVADLPAPKLKLSRLILPIRPHTEIEEYEFEIDVEGTSDFEAAGGAA
jgi:hypothetical protein